MTTVERVPEASRGAWAERLACRYLIGRGLDELAKNYRCRAGEIDLIMRDGQTLVFVEVRYRRHTHFGTGAESVDQRKQRRVVTAAQHYLQRHPALRDDACRFDVVSITAGGDDDDIEWITDAFGA